MNFKRMMTVVTVGATMFAGTVSAQAATSYARTKTVNVKHGSYYVANKRGKTYNFNGSTRKFRMKANHALKNYTKTTWTKTAQSYVTKNHKKQLYFYVVNAKTNVKGWVYAKDLKAGKNYQASSVKKTKSAPFYRAKSGKLVTISGKNSLLKLTNGKTLKTNLTYNRTKQRDVYLNGKKHHYYYVVSADNKLRGWIASDYLKAGKDYQMTGVSKLKATALIMAKAGKTYRLTGKNNAMHLTSARALSAKDNYTTTQARYIYMRNKKYRYYNISNTNGSVSGWVRSDYVKAGKHAVVTKQTSSSQKPTSTTKVTSHSSSRVVSSSSSSTSKPVTSSSSSVESVSSSSSSSVTSSSNSSSSSSTATAPVNDFAGKSVHAIYTGTSDYLYTSSDFTDANIASQSLKSDLGMQVYPNNERQMNFTTYALPVTLDGKNLYMKLSFPDLIDDGIYLDGVYQPGIGLYTGVVKPTDPSVRYDRPILPDSDWIYYYDGGFSVFRYDGTNWVQVS
ncbi:hypothetical protein ACFP1L_01590 [Lactiplantibacillus nangangensis]|uniref:Uncharacterized protein n=1 Tax=Lactiplantibacillus nangangensis TaxID=2559917 RepID=A0ABW1SH90_9LACO|nr:hypothetical protein [Lactiplantibacillus nangangensis]